MLYGNINNSLKSADKTNRISNDTMFDVLIGEGSLPHKEINSTTENKIMDQEKRIAERLKQQLVIDLKKDDHIPVVGITENISMGGLRFLSNEPFKKGDMINFSIHSPLEYSLITLPLQGEIAWTNELQVKVDFEEQTVYRAGVRFKHMDPQNLKILEYFLENKNLSLC